MLAVYWALPSYKAQNIFLLLGSYFFYACWDVRFLALIFAVTGAGYWAASSIESNFGDAKRRKQVLIAFLVFSLSLLGVFKYFDFFSTSLSDLMRSVGLQATPFLLHLVLPAAISFYTFESISYVVGAYKKELKSPASFLDFALFIGFFPKLVAGPIERPNVLIPQIRNKRTIDLSGVTRGVFLILLGLFKKVAIADGLAPFVSAVFDSPGTRTASEVALGSLAFAFQIYGDFSGYSDIARGVSMLFGIQLSLNFNFPYFSRDPSEFWRRWHISLSSWLRDYVYIPLGGNRDGEFHTYKNLILTMLVGGLWHGAGWPYIIWGLFHGALLAVHRWLSPLLAPVRGHASGLVRGLYSVFALGAFFLLTCYGWLLFRASSLQVISGMTGALLSGQTQLNSLVMPPLSALLGVPVLLLYDHLGHRAGVQFFHERWPAALRGALYATLMVLILAGASNARSAFIYFQF